MAKLNGHDVGAIAPLGEQAAAGVPPHWNSYVSVADVDATAALVAAAGGTVIMPPFDVMDAGRMAVMQDPDRRDARDLAGRRTTSGAGSSTSPARCRGTS